MNTLDRYIARMFLSGFAILLAVGIGMYIISDLLVNIDEFTRDVTLPLGQVMLKIADFYGCNIALYYRQLAGPVMAIAAAFTLGTLLRNNELTAITAAGIPLQRVAAPIIVCALGLVTLWVVNSEVIIPSLSAKIARVHGDVLKEQTFGLYAVRDENNAILFALEFFPQRGALRNVYIVEPDAELGEPRNLIQADGAYWDAASHTWVLERGLRMEISSPDSRRGLTALNRPEVVHEYAFSLSPGELLMRRDAQWSDYMSIGQLNHLLQSKNLPNRPMVKNSRHARLIQPLVQLVLLLLAMPALLTRERENVLAAGGRALLWTGSFYIAAFVAQGFLGIESTNEFTAAAIMWAPIFLFGSAAVVLLGNLRT